MQAANRAQRRAAQDAQRAAKLAASMTAACEFVLVRHGETAWNVERRLQGQQQPGPPLNELGWQQAALAAQVVAARFERVDAVISSDLLRTVQTAEVLAQPHALQVLQHPGLRERHLGALQGLTYDEAPAAAPDAWAALQSTDSATRVPGGGESQDELQARMVATLAEIAAQRPGQRVVLVSHGGSLHAIHKAARGYAAKGKVINCGISVLLVEPLSQQQQQQAQPQQQQAQQQQAQPPPPQQQEQQRQLSGCDSVSAGGSGGASSSQQLVSDAGGGGPRSRSGCGSSGGSNSAHCGSSGGSSCVASTGGDPAGAVAAAAAAQVDAGGARLALLVWNDGHELMLQGKLGAAGIHGFGGSAKEG